MAKMNIEYVVKVTDKFSRDLDRMTRQVKEVERAIDSVDTTVATTFNANTAAANSKIDETNRKIGALPRIRNIYVNVVGNFDNRFNKIAGRMRTIDEISLGMMKGGFFSMAPALGPLLAGAAGGAGALAASMTAAGMGAGAFTAVAIPLAAELYNIDQNMKKGSKEWNALPQYTRDAVTALGEVQLSLREFRDQFRKPIFEIFTQNLRIIKDNLGLFTPAIWSTIDAVKNLSSSFQESLNSADVHGFFTWLGMRAGPYLEQLTKTVGNFAMGFLNMMVAFDPLAQSFMDGFLNMSERFREWASTLETNQAFQNFVAYVQENGPTMLSLIGNIITTLVNLGIAMEPLATKVLEMANSFFAWTSEVLKNHEWVGQLIGVLFMFRGVIAMIGPIIAFVTATITSLTPVVIKIWSWFGKFGVKLQKVMPIVTRIGLTILRLSNPIGIIITAVILLATVIASNWDIIKTKTMQLVARVVGWFINLKNDVVSGVSTMVGNVVGFFSDLKNDAISYAAELANMVGQKYNDMKDAATEKMNDMWSSVQDIWGNIEEFFEGIDLYESGKAIIQSAIDGLDAMKSKVTGKVSEITSAIRDYWPFSPAKEGALRDLNKLNFGGPIVDSLKKAESPAVRAANRVADAIRKPLNGMSVDMHGVTNRKAASIKRGGYVEATTGVRDQAQGTAFTQNVTINSGQPASHSEVLRKQRQIMRDAAIEFGV
ncbi:phage tail protein [Thalassobacillus devorans]|uniref:phage tail protein n=1 Tax=Thalassobacillus devorans TaxID=279813 RepID=UPI000A1C98A1|nr:hypothetical protein [Thalassobacillus devorans]